MDRIAAGRQTGPMTGEQGMGADFSIGRVIARGLGAVSRRPVATCVPALLFGVLPASSFSYATDTGSNDDAIVIGFSIASLLVGAVTSATSQGALTPAVLDGEATLARAARQAVRSLGSLVAAGALAGAASLAAGALLLLPALLLQALWSVAGPAIVAERLGPITGLRRSAALVRPVFWRVVLLNLLLIAAYFAFWLALGLGGLYGWYGSGVFTGDGDATLPLGFYVLTAPLLALATAAWGAVVVALYAELRERMDGVPADRLRRIFA